MKKFGNKAYTAVFPKLTKFVLITQYVKENMIVEPEPRSGDQYGFVYQYYNTEAEMLRESAQLDHPKAPRKVVALFKAKYSGVKI